MPWTRQALPTALGLPPDRASIRPWTSGGRHGHMDKASLAHMPTPPTTLAHRSLPLA